MVNIVNKSNKTVHHSCSDFPFSEWRPYVLQMGYFRNTESAEVWLGSLGLCNKIRDWNYQEEKGIWRIHIAKSTTFGGAFFTDQTTNLQRQEKVIRKIKGKAWKLGWDKEIPVGRLALLCRLRDLGSDKSRSCAE